MVVHVSVCVYLYLQFRLFGCAAGEAGRPRGGLVHGALMTGSKKKIANPGHRRGVRCTPRSSAVVCACATSEEGGPPWPGVAPAAWREGEGWRGGERGEEGGL